jgi:potassium uptake TrkH family protein
MDQQKTHRDFKAPRLKVAPVQLIVLGYLLFAVAGTILLSLPVSLQPGVELSFIDALFSATSAISVTGLTVVNTPDTFNFFGRCILIFLFQFGGIGIMTLGTVIYVFLGNKISLRERMMIRTDQNQPSLQGMVYLMLFIFKVALIFELVATAILTAHFYFNHHLLFWNALGLAFFHSISGFTNAGFDLFGNSLQGFTPDYLIQAVIGTLILAGAIGFPVLLELYTNIIEKRPWKKLRFSLYTKVTVITYGILLLAGFMLILLFEASGPLANMPWHQKIAVAAFQSLTTRSSGFSTVDVGVFHSVTLLFCCLLMFIGSSPSSCGGGIRTTTFAVNILSTLAIFRGQSNTKIFRRELLQDDIFKALTVFFVATALLSSSVMVLAQTELFSLKELLFEACSAFGTTGLSLGITGGLTTTGKAILILLMFTGRIGLVTLFLIFRKKRPPDKDKYHYVKERIIIG